MLQQRLGALVRKVDSNDDNISEGGWKIIISLISIVVCIGVGALTFGYLEDLSAVDAIYFAVVTMVRLFIEAAGCQVFFIPCVCLFLSTLVDHSGIW